MQRPTFTREIGTATMEEDGTVVMNLVFGEGTDKQFGRVIYKTNDPGYWNILAKLSELSRERSQVIFDDWET